MPKPIFSLTSACASYYDDMLQADKELTCYMQVEKDTRWYVQHMSPDEYINACIDGFWKRTPPEEKQQFKGKSDFKRVVIAERLNDRSSFKDFDKLNANDKQICAPYLHYGYSYVSKHNTFTQEGLHRALWAKENGIPLIPVLKVYENASKVNRDDVPAKIECTSWADKKFGPQWRKGKSYVPMLNELVK
jgi:hypothetical protein